MRKSKKDKHLEEIESVFKENRKRVEELYEEIDIKEIQEKDNLIKEKIFIIKEKFKKFRRFFSTIVNSVVKKKNDRLSIKKEITIRDGEIYRYSSSVKINIKKILSCDDFFEIISKNCKYEDDEEKIEQLGEVIKDNKSSLLKIEEIIREKEDFYQSKAPDGQWVSYNTSNSEIYKCSSKSKSRHGFASGVEIHSYDEENALFLFKNKDIIEEVLSEALEIYEKLLDNLEKCLEFIQNEFISNLISKRI